MYNFHRTQAVNITCDKSEWGRGREQTRARANRYLADKHDKKKLHSRGNGLLVILFCSFGPGRHRYREHNQSYLSVQRNVLRRWLSYESALNARSNEINMPDENFRVIYEHGRHTENLREFVRNFSTLNSSREITIALTDLDWNIRESR